MRLCYFLGMCGLHRGVAFWSSLSIKRHPKQCALFTFVNVSNRDVAVWLKTAAAGMLHSHCRYILFKLEPLLWRSHLMLLNVIMVTAP